MPVCAIAHIPAREYSARQSMTSLWTQPIRNIMRLVVTVAVTMAALGSATAIAAPVDKASDRVAVRAFNHYVKASLAGAPQLAPGERR